MASRYWVGGTASWDGTIGTKWAATSGGAGGQSIPTSADDVFFNAASGAVTVSLASPGAAKSIDFTGFTGTFTAGSTLSVSGSVTLSGSTTYTAPAGTLNLLATGNVTSHGATWPGQIIVGTVGITVTLQDALSCLNASLTDSLNVTAGTLDANGFNVTCGTFTSNTTQTRTVAMGSGLWTIAGQGVSSRSGGLFNVANGTGLTLTSGTATLKFTGDGEGKYISAPAAGGLTFPNLWVNNGVLILNADGCTFKDIKLDGEGVVLAPKYGSTITVGSITQVNGGTGFGAMQSIRAETFANLTAYTPATINKTSGSQNLDWMALQNIIFGGGATWTATHSVDIDANSGITITAPSSASTTGHSSFSW